MNLMFLLVTICADLAEYAIPLKIVNSLHIGICLKLIQHTWELYIKNKELNYLML